MDIIYAKGEASVAEIASELPNPPTHTAIRTMVGILENKGYLHRRKQSREFIYMPKKARKRAGLSALQHVLKIFYEGSLEKALAAHLTERKSKLSEEELKQMVQLIQKARNKGK